MGNDAVEISFKYETCVTLLGHQMIFFLTYFKSLVLSVLYLCFLYMKN